MKLKPAITYKEQGRGFGKISGLWFDPFRFTVWTGDYLGFSIGQILRRRKDVLVLNAIDFYMTNNKE